MEQDAVARFTALFRQHHSLIVATCFRRLSDMAAAEDAAAEVFRVAWQRFHEQDNPSLAWLYGVVRNVVGNEYRRSARARSLRDRLVAEAIPEAVSTDGALVDALNQLKEGEREILFMSYWEDLTGEEISEILGISKPAVWVRLSRARDALRRQLDADSSDAAQSSRAGGRHHG